MNKKVVAMVLGTSLMLNAGALAFAATNLEEIKAYLNHDLKVKVDGKPVQLQDEQGKVVEPITYEGNTYLPVRAIANALGVGVDYDSSSSTVLLGVKAEGVAVSTEKFDNTYLSKDKNDTTYKGTDYKEVLINKESAGSFILSPNKKYSKLSLQVAALGKDIESIEIKDTDSFATLKKESVSINDGLKTIEVDIAGYKDIYVNIETKSGGGFLIPLTSSTYK
ncbi:stalk domain-containing protein [Paenibacillus sp. RC67]|uniref:stalk domain-containing protein n=1 Tax=Paenibacillus sp. RC67 TaxID=3039392 RepID=UPI0024AE061D|nr:stalk domain-containing protein [Paenibacillus sp. RC67]